MQESRTNQTETTAARQTPNNGGASQNQQVTTSKRQQGGNVTRSTGRESRALRRGGSRELASGSPFAMMRQLSREMDRLMDSFFEGRFGSSLRDTGFGEESWRQPTLWTPHIDVQRRNDAIVVRADLPGVRKEDVQIEVEDDSLIISGERREEGEENQAYHTYEQSYGSFYRAVPLPQGANPENVKAEMRDGVLSITVPLPENARPRRIEIKS